MRSELFHFRQSVLLQYHLNLYDAALLDWLLYFANSGRMMSMELNHHLYYWVRYDKVAEDLPCLDLSPRQLQRSFSRLSGEDGSGGPHPLLRHVHSTGSGRQTFYAVNWNVVNRLLNEEPNMDKLIEAGPTPTESLKRSRKLPPRILELLNVLLKVRMPGDGRLFQNRAPEDAWHYTKAIESFASKVLAIHAGKFLKEYPIHDRFYRLNPFTVNNDSRDKLRACEGDWGAVADLIIQCARNYRYWWRPEYEPENKDWLPRSLDAWMYNPRSESPVFLACINGPPPKLSDLAADRIWSSLPEKVINIAETIRNPDWDQKDFWTRIGSVILWYRTYEKRLKCEDSNAAYWFDGGQGPWFQRYVLWLRGFTKGVLFPRNIGTDCPTWVAWCTWAKKEHKIGVEVPSK